MAFDPRSLERLKELGRRLPQPLPQPAPPPAAASVPASERRHRVETETDPDSLFHQLMQVSPDGTVPPHLLQRLQELEASRQEQRREGRRLERLASSSSPSLAGPSARPPAGGGRPTDKRPDRRLAAEHPELYTEFQQLLLEDEEDPADP